MGWWRIDDSDETSEGLFNAIPGKNSAAAEYSGDGPADIMDLALEKIIKEYKDAWGRVPTRNELIASFEFSLSDYGEKE